MREGGKGEGEVRRDAEKKNETVRQIYILVDAEKRCTAVKRDRKIRTFEARNHEK